jgi:NADPH-dependent glutamate synthase beta subunit-like oxidoreductase
MCTPKLGELQSILVSASHCLDCADQRCMSLCPEHVDVPAAMRLILARPGSPDRSAWMQRADEATASAMSAIEASFD